MHRSQESGVLGQGNVGKYKGLEAKQVGADEVLVEW